MREMRRVAIGLLAAAGVGCGGDGRPLGPRDGIAPVVTIIEPAQQALVTTHRPRFVIRVADAEGRIFPGTINAVIDGLDVSQAFLNGYDASAGEIRVPGTVPVTDGAHTLELRVSDSAGNRGSASVTFTVLVDQRPPPGGDD